MRRDACMICRLSDFAMDNGFLTYYTERRAELAAVIGESSGFYSGENTAIREEIVRCLWFGSHFDAEELRTDDGKRIEVISPGWWNVEGGPDFNRAELLVEGCGHITGDVEVHTRSAAWREHGHHLQPGYNGVVLHVVMWEEPGGRMPVKENGEQLLQVTLSRYIQEELSELTDIIDMEAESAGVRDAAPRRFCNAAVRRGEIPLQWLNRFLDAAGDHRLQSRAESFRRRSESAPVEEVLYQSIAESLGYKNNRLAMLQLTRHLPLPTLRRLAPCDGTEEEKGRFMEAAFLGFGGFLEPERIEGADAETAAYIAGLRSIWNGLSGGLHRTGMSYSHWNLAGVRPANYPPRRLAALSRLYAGYLNEGLFGRIASCIRFHGVSGRKRPDTAMRGKLIAIFTNLNHPYWRHRYNFTSPRPAAPVALIGRQRAGVTLTNVLLPALLARARKDNDKEAERNVFLVWSRMPAPPPNRIVKRMAWLLFPDELNLRKKIHSTRRQQGLQQLYSDCCLAENGCAGCVLYRAYREGV